VSDVLERLRSALSASYRLEHELGAGGMATVYLAHDLRHNRPVALKVLHPGLAHALGPERFRREIEIAARLNHPHILTVLDSGDADGMLWYTMPLVEGESLRARLARERQLPLDESLRILREVAGALDYAHLQGVIHRDIKPENIMLSRGHALVADFGIARVLHEQSDRLTATGLAIGTPAYMSPEQASGERNLSTQSDVYSVASIAYEMLTGEPPYTGPSALAILTKRMTDPVPSPRRLRTAIPEGMDQAIARGLSPTPADRFPTAGELVRAMNEDRVEQPARAATRRKRVILAGVAVAGLFLIGVMIWPSRPAIDPGAEHLARGDFLLSKRTPADVGQALREFQSALAVARDSASALARIGYAYNLFFDWGWPYQDLAPAELRARALEYTERAIAADSSSAPAWLSRAYILTVDDPYHLRGAVAAYTRALQLDSTSAEGWYQFGQTLMVLGEDRRAAAAYRKAFSLDPNRPMALMSLSAMSLKNGQVDDARRLIDSAVAASRTVTSPYVRVVRGGISLLMGDARSARDDAMLALAMDTNYTVPARSLLVKVHLAEGDSLKAQAEANRLLADLEEGEVSTTSARFVAGALMALGRRRDAVDLFERARPRGAYLWFYMRSLEFRPLMADPAFRAIFEEAAPRPDSAW
jgi:serine/threonine protein kinase